MNLPITTDIKILYVDNKNLFNNFEGFGTYNSSVYVWCDLQQEFNYNFSDIHLKHLPIYIGKGIAFGNILNWRAVFHSNDALTNLIESNPNRYQCCIISIGINDLQAKCLEAILIKDLIENYNFSLTNYKEHPNTLAFKQLLNKKRERKNEILSQTILNSNGNNNR